MTRLFLVTSLLLLTISVSAAQSSGGIDYGLGGSSVMWMQHASALFLNPAELARIRQGELMFNSQRFSSLASVNTAFFVPFIGTFGAGVGSYGTPTQYTFGYARTLAPYHSFGFSMNGFRNSEETFGLSLGMAFHFPTAGENSGFHAGASILNLSDNTKSPFFSVNFGTAYWLIDESLRLQAAFQHTTPKNYGLFGTEFYLLPWMSFQIGTRSFNGVTGGMSLRFLYGAMALSAGKNGLVFSISASLSERAGVQRDENFNFGEEAFAEERFYDAAEYYRLAAQYDLYFSRAHAAADRALAAMQQETEGVLKQAKTHLQKKDFLEAAQAYSRALRMDPGNDEARDRLEEIEPQRLSFVHQLVNAGDSLRNRRDIDRARRSYQQALDLDPDNETIRERIAGLTSLERENVRSVLDQAKTALDRGQLDNAEREYRRVLTMDSRNSQARRGLAAVRSKRREELVEKGKSAFNDSDYLGAISIFVDVLKEDDQNREARDYLNRSRQALRPEIDNYFRAGLQFYTKDNYKAALEEWAKVLLIDPDHKATLEYRQRAEEKQKALERLK